MKLFELPEGWVWTRLGEIVVEIERGNPKDTPERDFIYLDIASIDNSQQKITNPKKYFGENAPSRARQLVKSGDILFSTVRTYLKNIAIVNEIYDGQIASTGFCVVRPYDLINRRLIFYLVQMDFFLNPLTQIQRGTSYPAVRDSDVFTQFIPLPPLPEQHRIVAKLEELFTKLDAGVEELKKVKAQLKRYRQAVLKYAFEGKLTNEWRAKHKGELEPASVLLARIKEERKKTLKGKYKELSPLDASELPELPDEWLWSGLRDFAEFKNGINFNKNQKGDEGILTIDVLNMYSKGPFVSLDKLYRVNKPLNDGYFLKFGDILFVRSSVKREGVGWASTFKEISESVTFCGFIIRARLQDLRLSPEYVTYFLRTNSAREFIISSGSQVTITNITQNSIGKIPVPIAPSSEQQKIVEEIERRFSVADAVEKVVDQNLKQAEKLRQSILKRAFEGKLVPQDPTDEPASVLLERIKAARENRKLEVKSKPTKNKRKSELVQVQKQTRFNDYV